MSDDRRPARVVTSLIAAVILAAGALVLLLGSTVTNWVMGGR